MLNQALAQNTHPKINEILLRLDPQSMMLEDQQ